MVKATKTAKGITDEETRKQPPAASVGGNVGGNGHKAQATLPPKSRIDPATLRRTRPVREEDEIDDEPTAVSAGPVDKVIELAFNPTRDKIREVTIIDRMQGRLFPQLDMINTLLGYCVEIAFFRENKDNYIKLFKRPRPLPPNAMDEFVFRTAQWQKSVGGKNLERATDIALAETEGKSGDDGSMSGGNDPWAGDK